MNKQHIHGIVYYHHIIMTIEKYAHYKDGFVRDNHLSFILTKFSLINVNKSVLNHNFSLHVRGGGGGGGLLYKR